MRPELLKGHLDALLLAVLEPGPQHGYAVIEALRSGSDGALDLPTGTVYPALHRLERAGLIASDWQTVGGRRRRAYHLTAGRARRARRATRRVGPVLHRRNRPPHEANMASDRLATSTVRPPEGALAAYLSDLAAQLHGPRRRREAILTELRDGLDQATEDRIATGLAPDQAAAAAITQFGSPHAVADAFAGELATAYARRTIACFIATGPLVGIWWLLLLAPKPLAHRPDRAPRGDPRHPADHHRDRHRRRHPRHHRTPNALAARNRPAPCPGRHHRHRRAVHDHRPHHDHHPSWCLAPRQDR